MTKRNRSIKNTRRNKNGKGGCGCNKKVSGGGLFSFFSSNSQNSVAPPVAPPAPTSQVSSNTQSQSAPVPKKSWFSFFGGKTAKRKRSHKK